jgi:hypothetical protein
MVDRDEGGAEGSRVPIHEGFTELGFAGEVVVQARLGEAQLPSDVGVSSAGDRV